MAPWFDLYTKESEVALFAVFGWKLRLLAYFAYYFTSSGQNWLFCPVQVVYWTGLAKSITSVSK